MASGMVSSLPVHAGAPGRRTHISNTSAEWLTMLLVWLCGLVMYRGFLPELVDATDGFRSQIFFVLGLITDGSLLEVASENPLMWVHVGRLVAVAPFLGIEFVLGPAASLPLLLLLLLPLTRFAASSPHRMLRLLPLALPLFVSGRSVLVAAGLGYAVIFLTQPRARTWGLWLGTLFANLSSASVLASILMLLFVRAPSARRHAVVWQRLLVLLVLVMSFIASALDKAAGFSEGGEGYQAATFDSDNLFLIAIGRSTLLISLAEGDYLRAVVYFAIQAYLLLKIASLLVEPRLKLERRVLLCCVPGIFLEGLGVLAMFFPLVWLLLRVRFDPTAPLRSRRRRPRVPPSTPAEVVRGG
jgi:hypothetical protein